MNLILKYYWIFLVFIFFQCKRVTESSIEGTQPIIKLFNQIDSTKIHMPNQRYDSKLYVEDLFSNLNKFRNDFLILLQKKHLKIIFKDALLIEHLTISNDSPKNGSFYSCIFYYNETDNKNLLVMKISDNLKKYRLKKIPITNEQLESIENLLDINPSFRFINLQNGKFVSPNLEFIIISKITESRSFCIVIPNPVLFYNYDINYETNQINPQSEIDNFNQLVSRCMTVCNVGM